MKLFFCLSEITAVAYCPLQDVAVTAAKDVTMRVWGSNWELLTTFVGHTGVCVCVRIVVVMPLEKIINNRKG